jgi:hypothetical protein
MLRRYIFLGLCLALVALAIATAVSAHEGEHGSNTTLNKLYVFTTPEDSSRLAVLATFGPFEKDQSVRFSNDHLYEIAFDTNRDGNADRVVQAFFSGIDDNQHVRVVGPSVPERIGTTHQEVTAASISGDVSYAANPHVIAKAGHAVRAFAGLRDAPESDAQGTNVLLLAVDLPLSDVLAENEPNIDVWASVSLRQP